MGVALIFAVAALLAVVPHAVDRWALARGASPEALAALALVTLAGVAAVPVAFALCTGTLAAHESGEPALRFVAVAGLLLVAVAAGRALGQVVRTQRAWRRLSRAASVLGLRQEAGVGVLPVAEPLAFASGTLAFVSEGLLERLPPPQRRAVIAHEREHAAAGHARLASAAGAVRRGLFGVVVARRAEAALHRELDALADAAAAGRVGDPAVVAGALRALAGGSGGPVAAVEETALRLERLAREDARRNGRVDAAVRIAAAVLAVAVLAAICVSIHAGTVWLGVAACALLIGGFLSLTMPSLRSRGRRPSSAPDSGGAR